MSNDYALSLSLSLSPLSQFPHSNISLILSKLRGPASAHLSHIETAFASADPNNTGTLLFDQFSYVTLMLRVVSKKYFLSVAFFIFIVYFLCFQECCTVTHSHSTQPAWGDHSSQALREETVPSPHHSHLSHPRRPSQEELYRFCWAPFCAGLLRPRWSRVH